MGYIDLLNSYHEEMKKTLGESIAYPSVLSDAVRTADGEILPYGRNVHDCFLHMMSVGESMGFTTYNAENYGGHIEFPASEEAHRDGVPETFGIITHLDVVPEGSGWEHEPFKMAEDNGFLYGRGTSDDKGPLVACLYAMKALKEAGVKPKKNIRLVMGLDEETGCTGMPKYLELAGEPDQSFTPDAEFPVLNGEMGILIFDLARKMTRQTSKEGIRLTKLEGGTAANAVPRTAKAVITCDEEIYNHIKDRLAQYVLETGYDIKIKKQGSSYVIETVGKASHGSRPAAGLNAITILFDFLGRLQFENDEINEFIAFYNEHIGFDFHGERLGCEFEDEPSGKLIVNVGMVAINEDIAQLTLNIRYPVSNTDEEVYAGIESIIGDSKIGIVKDTLMEPLYFEPDDPFVVTLMEKYVQETGDTESRPITFGGGTYAKTVKNCVAYGALFPGETDTMHQADERMSEDSFYKMARIYANTIYSLCCE